MATSVLAATTTPQQREAAQRALAAEADARGYPEEAAQCLLEAAADWRAAGDAERAQEVLAGWQTWPDPVDAGLARIDLAESLLQLSRPDEAERVLAALQAERPPPAVCNAAGELCEELEQWLPALAWFEVGLRALSADDVAAAADPLNCVSDAALVLRGRRESRAALGLPPDDLDRSLPQPGDLGRLLFPPFPTSQELLADPEAALAGRAVRTLFWPRNELAAAQERWPATFGGEPSVYHRNLEQRLAELAARTGRAVTLVAARVGPLVEFADRTGNDVRDDSTRRAFLQREAEQGRVTTWPPGRNDRCWCESGVKYKRCCGRGPG